MITRNKTHQDNADISNISNISQPKKFICIGGYPDIKNALVQRGWIQNTEYER